MRIALTLTLALFCVAPLAAQATNDALLTFTVNGVDGMAPNTAEIQRPGTAVLDVTTQNPNLPIIIAVGSNIAIADQVIGPVQVDVGPGAQVLLNGVSPVSFLDFLGNTGNSGTFQLALPLGSQLNIGPLAALQAFAVDFTAPGGVVDSSATLIELVDPIDFGTVSHLRGLSTSDTTSFTTTAGVGTTAFNLPSSSIDLEGLNLNNYSEFVSNTSAQIDSELDPAIANRALSNAKNTSYDHIKTVFGDIYHFDDLNANPREFGFALQIPGGPLLEIVGSRFNNPTTTGFSTISPWEIECAVSPDQTTLAVVYDPSSGNDQLYLIKLDGTTFASTGNAAVNVTQAAPSTNILEESIRFSGNRIYYVAGSSTTTGNLFGAPIDGSAPASPVSFPLLGTGGTTSLIDGETVRIDATDSILVLGGNGGSNEDLFVISNPGGVETVTNITNFAFATNIETLDDAYDGFDGHVGASPDGSRVAFVIFENSDDELYWVTTDGLGTPEHLTSNATFNVGIDDIVDINFWDNQNILFFTGTTTSAMDLYNINVTTPGSPVITNVTQTNGQSGATLPISNTPTAMIEPDGYFTAPGRMIFGRDGTPSGGTGTSTAFGLVGVEYATLTAYNILGDEFAGTAGEVGYETSQTGLELTRSAGGTMVWFKSAVAGSSANDEELFGFDSSLNGPAINYTAAGGTGSSQVDNITPDFSGLSCAFSYRPSSSGDEEVFVAMAGSPGVLQFSDGDGNSNDITDGSIRWLPLTNPTVGLVFSQGTTSTTNPTDAIIQAASISNGQITDVDTTPGTAFIGAISFP